MSEADIILALEQRWVTRDELKAMLSCGDRTARAYIEELNEKLANYGKCIVSTSSRAGYHIPNPFDENDLRLVSDAIDELKSKAVSIFVRRKSLEDFLRSAASAKDSETEIQLSLF